MQHLDFLSSGAVFLWISHFLIDKSFSIHIAMIFAGHKIFMDESLFTHVYPASKGVGVFGAFCHRLCRQREKSK